jgi:hypothetical protein
MTTQLETTSVTTQTEVDAPVEHAFRVFTEGIGSWWNPDHHILQAELAEMVFEPSPTTLRTGSASAGT